MLASMPAGMRWRAALPGGGDWSGDCDEERRGGEATTRRKRKGTGGAGSSVTTGRDVWGRLESAVNGSDLIWGSELWASIESNPFFLLGRH